MNKSIELQKPAKSYTYKEKIWLLDGKISKKEANLLNVKNKLLKKRQTLANINSSIKKKRVRISDLKETIKTRKEKGRSVKNQNKNLDKNKESLKKLLSKRDKVKDRISFFKEKRDDLKEKLDKLETKKTKVSEKISFFFINLKDTIVSFFKAEKAYGNAWANESYAYKLSVNINGESEAGEGQQILLKIAADDSVSGADFNLNGNSQFFPEMKDDGGDLIFYSSDEVAQVPFWVEKVENGIAWVWVKVLEDLSSEKTIHLYYGNSGPVNHSNGDETFEFFDDFGSTGPDTSKWASNFSRSTFSADHVQFENRETITSRDLYGPGHSVIFKGSLANMYSSIAKSGFYGANYYSTSRYKDFVIVGRNGKDIDYNHTETERRFEISKPDANTQEFYADGELVYSENDPHSVSDRVYFYQGSYRTRVDTKLDYVFVIKKTERSPQFGSVEFEQSRDQNNAGGEVVVEEVDGYVYTYYEYDIRNNLVKIEDADGNEREFVYDSLGRQVSSELPHVPGENAAMHTYTHDLAGNKTSETRPDGTVINYTYDNLNRMLTVDNPAEPGIETTYTYDTATNGIGMLASVSGQDANTAYSKSYTYDRAGNITSETLNLGGETHTTSYVYSSYGLMDSTIYPDGTVVANAYNLDGSTESVSRNSSNVVSFEYNHIGQITDKDYANGIEEDYVYSDETLFRLESKTVSNGVNDLEDIEYAYDEIGNITSIENSGSEVSYEKVYTYDSLERLQTATTTIDGSVTADVYTYSNSGNILSHNDDIYSYENVTFPQAATAYKGSTYTYDSNGNLSTKNDGTDTKTYSYDWNDRLSSVDDTRGNIASYGYSENRQRLSKEVDGSIKYYIGETTEIEGGNTTNYVFAGNSRVATINNTGDIAYSHSDHLGSGSLETNNSGDVTSALTYKPFGSEEVSVGEKSNDHTYTDQEKDSETGLMYYNARYYDPELKRFTSVDAWSGELTNSQTQNKYTYVNNNPLKYTDPTGNCYNGSSCDGAKDTIKNLPQDLWNGVNEVAETAILSIWGVWDQNAAGALDQKGQQLAQGIQQTVDTLSNFDQLSKEQQDYMIGSLGTGLLFGALTKKLSVPNASDISFLNRGSTGRTNPNTLEEKLFMESVMTDPTQGNVINMRRPMGDPRWNHSDGWEKVEAIHTQPSGHEINIHYVGQYDNGVLKAVDDFKFKSN